MTDYQNCMWRTKRWKWSQDCSCSIKSDRSLNSDEMIDSICKNHRLFALYRCCQSKLQRASSSFHLQNCSHIVTLLHIENSSSFVHILKIKLYDSVLTVNLQCERVLEALVQSQNWLNDVEPELHIALIMLYASMNMFRSSLCIALSQLLSSSVASISQL